MTTNLITTIERYQGARLPDVPIDWREPGSPPVPVTFQSDPHTFVLTLASIHDRDVAIVRKTTGFAVFDTAPSLVVLWGDEYDDIPPGTYEGEIFATRIADGKPRQLPFRLVMRRRTGTVGP